MASACINKIVFSPEYLSNRSRKHHCLTPLSSLAVEMPNQNASEINTICSPANLSHPPEKPDQDLSDVTEFEFRLQQPVTMLPADELFSDGKLFPLHFPVIRQDTTSTSTSAPATDFSLHKSPYTPEPLRETTGVSVVDSFSVPRFSSRWKQLLGLKKLCQNNNKTTSSPSSGGTKSIKNFLQRSSKPCEDPSVNLPLLNDTDNEQVASAPSLSSSSSSGGQNPDDIPPPRVSVDSEKPVKVKLVKTRTLSGDGSVRCVGGVTIESPRMNSSGKIVFHGLERSSSSPSSFYGGPRFKHREVERTYSGNVRVAPVLNVPICSLIGSSKSGGVFGLPLFSSSQKQEVSSGSNRGASRSQQTNGKTKTAES